MEWVLVGRPDAVNCRWFKNGSEVSTGTALVHFYRYNPGIQYLQTDFTTWLSTPANHTATFVGGDQGWSLPFTPTSSMVGPTIFARMLHSDIELSPLTDTYKVTTSDTDTIVTGTSAGFNGLLLAPSNYSFNGPQPVNIQFTLHTNIAPTSFLTDPDSNLVALSVVDGAGNVPSYVTGLGAMTRLSQGVYSISPTINASSVEVAQLVWSASYTKNAVTDVVKATTVIDRTVADDGAHVETG